MEMEKIVNCQKSLQKYEGRNGRFCTVQVQKQHFPQQFQMRTIILCLLVAVSLAAIAPLYTMTCVQNSYPSSSIQKTMTKKFELNSTKLPLLSCTRTPPKNMMGASTENLMFFFTNQSLVFIKLIEKPSIQNYFNASQEVLLGSKQIAQAKNK